MATGNGRFADHHALMAHRTLPWALGLLSFLLIWQVMIAAMMLPTSLPMIRLFARASGGQRRPGLVRAVFVAAYLAVWTGFAALAYVGDAALHALAMRAGWPGDHPAAITGGGLLLAGWFQFSQLKERCLHECRHPARFLLRPYRRGPGPAWSLGVRHGLFCLGCCWALMLLMFAVGVGEAAGAVGQSAALPAGWLPPALRGDTVEHAHVHASASRPAG